LVILTGRWRKKKSSMWSSVNQFRTLDIFGAASEMSRDYERPKRATKKNTKESLGLGGGGLGEETVRESNKIQKAIQQERGFVLEKKELLTEIGQTGGEKVKSKGSTSLLTVNRGGRGQLLDSGNTRSNCPGEGEGLPKERGSAGEERSMLLLKEVKRR